MLGPAAAFLLAVTVSPSPQVRPLSEAPEVLAVYTEDWGLESAGGRGLIAAVWADGYAVWSENRLEGGGPFLRGRVDKVRVASLLARLRTDGALDDARLAQANFGPDSRFTTILVRTAGQSLGMRSWHERAEAGGGVIASAAGLQSLEKSGRLAELKRQPAEYLYYRAVWGELRWGIQALLPARGERVAGRAVLRQGIMTWSEP